MTIFTRVLLACLLPLIIIFSVVLLSIGYVVRDQGVRSAESVSNAYANEISKHIGDGFVNITALLDVVEDYVASVNHKNPNAEEILGDWVKSILKATPYVYNIWVSFEPGGFFPDERFSRDYVNVGDSIVTIFDLDDDKLDDPEEAPWYYYPFREDITWFETADWYDYELGYGAKYTGTVSKAITRADGKPVGVVGIDMLYEDIFDFINERQEADGHKIIIITQSGEIVFSSDSALVKTSLFDIIPQGYREKIEKMLELAAPFNITGMSPFHNEPAVMFFHPVRSLESESEPLYLYVDKPQKVLFGEVYSMVYVIIALVIIGLVVFALVLYMSLRTILMPIKKLTAGASMIASGHIDMSFSAMLEKELGDKSKVTSNEFHLLFSALKNMGNAIALSEKYKAVSTAKSEFLAKMSHEIRTPMNAITGMAELALREEMSQAAKEHVITIKQAAANLLSIINDILDLSKIESGKFEIVPTDYQFSSLVNDVVSIIRMRVLNSMVRFTVNVDRKIPSVLYGDEVRIRQILLNILSNAVKYTKEGHITLFVRGEIVDTKTVLITIEVSDTGSGLKPDKIERLFDTYVQLDTRANREIEGTGLGLAITKNLTTAMGGEISVESEYGKGSKFTVALPQKIRSHQPLAEVINPQGKSVLIYERRDVYATSMTETLDNLGVYCKCVINEHDLKTAVASGKFTFLFIERTLYENTKINVPEITRGMQIVLLTSFGSAAAEKGVHVVALPVYSITVANVLNGVTDNFAYNTTDIQSARFCAPEARVLVVDDIKTNLEVARGLLLPYEMQLDTCLNGPEAIIAVANNKYDVIFMDHMMPGMDGIEATKKIRALEFGATVPIIALTANAVYGNRELFIQSGMNDFLPKPIDTLKLDTMLERWIPKHKQKPITKKAAQVSDTVDFAIEGIDTKLGMSRTGGTRDGYLRTLEIFCEDGMEKIGEINSVLKTGDIGRYTTYVHALKSASANIGATELSEAAAVLEAAGKRGDMAVINADTQKVLSGLETLLHQIRAVIAEKKAVVRSEVNDDELKAVLAKLKYAIDDVDPGTMNTTVKELSRFEGSPVSDDIKKIAKCVLNGDYDEAIAVIDKIL